MYVVRKYVKAPSVQSALKKEKTTPVHDCFVSEEWSNRSNQHLAEAIGFHHIEEDDEEYDDEE